MATGYDAYLGPFMFEPFAKDLASRLKSDHVLSVLEIASGTGRLTRYLRAKYPDNLKITATDISEDMLAVAAEKLKGENISFEIANAQSLSFENDSFDVVACQFGMMFLSDRSKGFSEVYRVLKPGGQFIFSTWDALKHNPFFDLVFNEYVIPYAKDKPADSFLIPFNMNDEEQLKDYMSNAGFRDVSIEKLTLTCESASVENISKAYFLPGNNTVTEERLQAIRKTLANDLRIHFGEPMTCDLTAFVCQGFK